MARMAAEKIHACVVAAELPLHVPECLVVDLIGKDSIRHRASQVRARTYGSWRAEFRSIGARSKTPVLHHRLIPQRIAANPVGLQPLCAQLVELGTEQAQLHVERDDRG